MVTVSTVKSVQICTSWSQSSLWSLCRSVHRGHSQYCEVCADLYIIITVSTMKSVQICTSWSQSALLSLCRSVHHGHSQQCEVCADLYIMVTVSTVKSVQICTSWSQSLLWSLCRSVHHGQSALLSLCISVHHGHSQHYAVCADLYIMVTVSTMQSVQICTTWSQSALCSLCRSVHHGHSQHCEVYADLYIMVTVSTAKSVQICTSWSQSALKSMQVCTTINDLHQTHKPHFSVQKGRLLKSVLQRNIVIQLQTAVCDCRSFHWHKDTAYLATVSQNKGLVATSPSAPNVRPYDLGKLEVNQVAPNTRTEHIQKLVGRMMCTGSDHYYIKLQETSFINNTRLVVGFWHQQYTISNMIKWC